MATQDNDFTTKTKEYNRQVWEGLLKLKALQTQWQALDYGTTLVVDDPELVAADFGAVVFATTDAMLALLAQGHATNMARLL